MPLVIAASLAHLECDDSDNHRARLRWYKGGGLGKRAINYPIFAVIFLVKVFRGGAERWALRPNFSSNRLLAVTVHRAAAHDTASESGGGDNQELYNRRRSYYHPILNTKKAHMRRITTPAAIFSRLTGGYPHEWYNRWRRTRQDSHQLMATTADNDLRRHLPDHPRYRASAPASG